ncbi:hypothetical protein [Sphingomonas sp.]|jgi:hypothetical protein|uniref:hypothetical protein n=1 Tax=Sphingomonas sp. TaxID=28214 RepID=UPI002612342B|nr:hypothetical protein [Sphingomonas sp.]MDK2768250.1 hypothetical protein [Sphingomonas sp.]
MKTGLALGALLLAAPMISTPAIAQDAAPAAAKPVKEKKICRRDNTVGTRLAKYVCLTRAQWESREAAARTEKDRVIDSAEREGRDAWTPYAQPSGG